MTRESLWNYYREEVNEIDDNDNKINNKNT